MLYRKNSLLYSLAMRASFPLGARTSRPHLLLVLVLFIPIPATAQQPQAPSPMVESTRPHPRIAQTEVKGSRVELQTLKGARLFIGPRVNPSRPVPLLIHFHGAPWLIEQHIAAHLPKTALVTVQLGAGSSVYRRPFEQPDLFSNLLREAAAELHLRRGWSSITLSGFSAGYGAVREILRHRDSFALVNNVLLLDGMHTSYMPEGKPLADGGAIDPAGLDSFIAFAKEAVAGRKSFVFTHSEIFPGTYASTTECADFLLAQLNLQLANLPHATTKLKREKSKSSPDDPNRGVGKVKPQFGNLNLKRRPQLRQGPLGMQQLSAVDAGRFHVRGYAGNTAPDHIDHLQAMPAWFGLLLRGH
jgi:hypothetical protein